MRETPIVLSTDEVRAVLEGERPPIIRAVKHPFLCPFGKPGDRLRVKEALRGVIDRKIDPAETMPICAYEADGTHLWTKHEFRQPWRWDNRGRLPALCMPRWAGRITLEVTDVGVQMTQDIRKPWVWTLEFRRVE